MADFTIARHGQSFTVTPRTTAALCFLILETTDTQRPSKTIAVLDLAAAMNFTSKAATKGYTMNTDPLTAHIKTIPPTWARLKEHYFTDPKAHHGGLFQRHSGMLPDLHTLGKLIPSTFQEVPEWRDGLFRAVYMSTHDRALITYCEGDFDLEEYPDEGAYAAAIMRARLAYVDGKTSTEALGGLLEIPYKPTV